MKLRARPLILLLSAFLVLGNVAACFDDDDDDGGIVVQPFTLDLAMNPTNAAAVAGIAFEFDDLSFLDPRFSGESTMTFTETTLRIEGGGTVVEGPVTFGSNSCTVEGIVASPCGIRITTTEPIEVNSYLSGSPVAQREDAREGFVTAAGELLRLTPKLLHAQPPVRGTVVVTPGTIGDRPHYSRGYPATISALGGVDGSRCIAIGDACTTGRITASGTATGSSGGSP